MASTDGIKVVDMQFAKCAERQSNVRAPRSQADAIINGRDPSRARLFLGNLDITLL